MPRETKADGLRWTLREGTDDRLGPAHEMVLDAVIELPEGGVFVDVGAHVGHFTLRLARRASHVLAFEPGSEQRAGLEENLRLNGIGNVRVVPMALWDKPTRLGFRAGPGGENGQSVVFESPEGDLPATTLDAEAAGLPRVDVVKIDVQGAEARVLEGARDTLARHQPRLVVELHDRELARPEIRAGVERVLEACGYAWRQVHANVTNDYLVAAPVGREAELARAAQRAAWARRREVVVLAPVRVRDGIARRLGLLPR